MRVNTRYINSTRSASSTEIVCIQSNMVLFNVTEPVNGDGGEDDDGDGS